jgi:hypothetical protein
MGKPSVIVLVNSFRNGSLKVKQHLLLVYWVLVMVFTAFPIVGSEL